MPSPFDLPPLLTSEDPSLSPPTGTASDSPVVTAATSTARAHIGAIAETPVHAVALEVAVRLIRPYAAGTLRRRDARELERMCTRYGIRLDFDPAQPVTPDTPVGVRREAPGGNGGPA